MYYQSQHLIKGTLAWVNRSATVIPALSIEVVPMYQSCFTRGFHVILILRNCWASCVSFFSFFFSKHKEKNRTECLRTVFNKFCFWFVFGLSQLLFFYTSTLPSVSFEISQLMPRLSKTTNQKKENERARTNFFFSLHPVV